MMNLAITIGIGIVLCLVAFVSITILVSRIVWRNVEGLLRDRDLEHRNMIEVGKTTKDAKGHKGS